VTVVPLGAVVYMVMANSCGPDQERWVSPRLRRLLATGSSQAHDDSTRLGLPPQPAMGLRICSSGCGLPTSAVVPANPLRGGDQNKTSWGPAVQRDPRAGPLEDRVDERR